MSSVHDGHRMRLKERFLKEGLDSFEPHNVLELLLFYVFRRGDTNETAHALMKQFGSLHGVLNADVRMLKKVKGVGPETATFLRMVQQVARYYYIDTVSRKKVILNTTQKIGDYLIPKFMGLDHEEMYLMSLTTGMEMVGCKRLFSGSITSVQVYLDILVKEVVLSNGAYFVIAHNHPEGYAIASPEDFSVTRQIREAISLVDRTLIDHIIISDNEYTSLKESGFFDRF